MNKKKKRKIFRVEALGTWVRIHELTISISHSWMADERILFLSQALLLLPFNKNVTIVYDPATIHSPEIGWLDDDD